MRPFLCRIMYVSLFHILHGVCFQNLAAKCVDLFILHTSLVRPMNNLGRSHLASDCAYLETALEPIFAIGQLKKDDPCLLRLRAFRILLSTDAKAMTSSPVVIEQRLPFSICLHLLFSFAPPELKSPHESAGLLLSCIVV